MCRYYICKEDVDGYYVCKEDVDGFKVSFLVGS